ncbi:transposase [Streptomyces umbrinus]|uniref:transposase n=1 Tax=Streptomyces umbrinus TaxID=67370 RepID=UPI0033F9DDFD
MSKRYTVEFKQDAVALALSSEKTVTEVARDLGVSPEGLRRLDWMAATAADWFAVDGQFGSIEQLCWPCHRCRRSNCTW